MVATLLARNIRRGWQRVADENPTLDFSRSTPEIDATWAELNAEAVKYDKGMNKLVDVHRAFTAWEQALKGV